MPPNASRMYYDGRCCRSYSINGHYFALDGTPTDIKMVSRVVMVKRQANKGLSTRVLGAEWPKKQVTVPNVIFRAIMVQVFSPISAFREALNPFDHGLALLADALPSPERSGIERLLRAARLIPQRNLGGRVAQSWTVAWPRHTDAGDPQGRARVMVLEAEASLLVLRGQLVPGTCGTGPAAHQPSGDPRPRAGRPARTGVRLRLRLGDPVPPAQRSCGAARSGPAVPADARGARLGPMAASRRCPPRMADGDARQVAAGARWPHRGWRGAGLLPTSVRARAKKGVLGWELRAAMSLAKQNLAIPMPGICATRAIFWSIIASGGGTMEYHSRP
jgi:hypothetical protein